MVDHRSDVASSEWGHRPTGWQGPGAYPDDTEYRPPAEVAPWIQDAGIEMSSAAAYEPAAQCPSPSPYGEFRAGSVVSSKNPVRRRGGARKPLTIDDETQAYDPFAHDPRTPDAARQAGGGRHDEVWNQLDQLPSIDDDPVVFDHRQGGFVRVDPALSPKAPRPEQTRARAEQPLPPVPPPPPPPANPRMDPTMIAPDPTRVAPGHSAAAHAAGAHVASSRGEESPIGWQRSAGAAPAAPPAPVAPSAAPPPPPATPYGAPPPPPASPAPSPAQYAPPPPPPPHRPAPAQYAPPAPPAHRPAPPARPIQPARPVKPVRPAKAKRPRRRGRLIKRLVVAFLAFILLMVGGLFAFGWWQFNKIDKIDVANVLSKQTGPGTNYLIVGTDSREGINPNDKNAGAFLGQEELGGSARTDSIMILRVEGANKSLLSIPRDLWVTNPRTGKEGRINSVYQSGPAVLIKAVQNLGIPVHHYAEINFVSFAGLVDAVGGIEIDFPFPTRDKSSGLNIEKPGVTRLDGVQGLAYARSRHYEELKNGKWVEDPNSDLTRVLHQRAFLGALLNKITDTKNPLTLARVGSSFGAGLKLDNAMSYFDALGLAWNMRGFNPSGTTVPTVPVNKGGAEVLEKAPNAKTVLQQFG